MMSNNTCPSDLNIVLKFPRLPDAQKWTLVSSGVGGAKQMSCLYHYQRDVNTSNEGKCLVEFFFHPPSARYRLQFHRICMKTGPKCI